MRRRLARYRLRLRVRQHLPWFLIDLGLANKGRGDCGDHAWYRSDAEVDHCYYCVGERPYDPGNWAG